MNIIHKFRTASTRKAARWGLVMALVLLLVLSAASSFGHPSTTLKAGAQDRQENKNAEGQAPISKLTRSVGLQYPTSSRTVTYAYDSAGRLTRAGYGEDGALVYRYDPGGNLVGVTPGGENYVYLPLVLRQSP